MVVVWVVVLVADSAVELVVVSAADSVVEWVADLAVA